MYFSIRTILAYLTYYLYPTFILVIASDSEYLTLPVSHCLEIILAVSGLVLSVLVRLVLSVLVPIVPAYCRAAFILVENLFLF